VPLRTHADDNVRRRTLVENAGIPVIFPYYRCFGLRENAVRIPLGCSVVDLPLAAFDVLAMQRTHLVLQLGRWPVDGDAGRDGRHRKRDDR
jgi:hypothetical protein